MTSTIKTLYITGYSSFELGVFTDKDPKIPIIKKALRKNVLSHIDNGLSWVIISGNLGTEYWASQVVSELKKEGYQIKLGLIFPFFEFGSNWNDSNKQKVSEMQAIADYENATSHHPYQGPSQFRNHTQFLLDNTDGALLVYDKEYPGKTNYLLKEIDHLNETQDYYVELIDMYSLQEIAED